MGPSGFGLPCRALLWPIAFVLILFWTCSSPLAVCIRVLEKCMNLYSLCMSHTFRNHSKIIFPYQVISSFWVNLPEWIHSKMLRPEIRNSLTMMDQCELKRPTGKQCHFIADATPLLHSLQPSTTPVVVSVLFFNHLLCRMSTMAQVPPLVAKSLFNAMQLSLSKMKSLFGSCCNYLKQLSLLNAS